MLVSLFMAPPQAPAAQVAQPGQQPPAQQGWTGSLAGFVRMGIFWYFAMQMFGPKKVTDPDLLTNNLFMKGEKLVILTPSLSRMYKLCVLFSACHISGGHPDWLKLEKAYGSLSTLQFDCPVSKFHNLRL